MKRYFTLIKLNHRWPCRWSASSRIVASGAAFGLAAGALAANAARGAAPTAGSRGAGAGSSKSAPSGHGGQHAWSYGNGPKGPLKWGSLNENFETCDSGADQSPLNLTKPKPGEGDTLVFDYLPTPFRFLNNGHTLQFEYAPGSVFDNGSERFDLVQFHFHSPSEHLLEGKALPLEVHLVHKNKNQKSQTSLAVVGVFFMAGTENRLLQPLFENIPTEGESDSIPGLMLNAMNLLPEKRGYYYYPGSLTTPPCSEGVAWHVLKNPVMASPQQIALFRKHFANNARPIQKLNDRILREN